MSILLLILHHGTSPTAAARCPLQLLLMLAPCTMELYAATAATFGIARRYAILDAQLINNAAALVSWQRNEACLLGHWTRRVPLTFHSTLFHTQACPRAHCFQAWLVRGGAVYLNRSLVHTDERAKVEAELLAGIEVVKCSTWEVSASCVILPGHASNLAVPKEDTQEPE